MKKVFADVRARGPWASVPKVLLWPTSFSLSGSGELRAGEVVRDL